MASQYANGRDLRERLLSGLIIEPETGCLLWTRTVNPDGYGMVSVGGVMRTVHTVMYEMFAGPVPAGAELDHLCHTDDPDCDGTCCPHRRCASVAHLEPVTHRENSLRSRSLMALNALKEACPAGHAYDLVNTYFHRGHRLCRPCNRAAVARYRARKRAT